MLFRLIVLFLGSSLATVFAGVGVNGRVTLTNPVTGVADPLPGARVRVVFAELVDADTGDVETTTDRDGRYAISKTNPWFRDGYDALVIVVAEAPGKLEVQHDYATVDGYQARTARFYVRENRTVTRNIHIGGNADSVNRYEEGGILGLDNADLVDRQRGQRAFFIYHESTDHRLRLQDKALGPGDFEEKEVAFPAGTGAAYRRPFDYIRIAEQFFNNTPLVQSSGFRHELSHGIMADAFWLYPGWWEELTFNSRTSPHFLQTEHPNEDYAWIEAWAAFLSEVTLFERYGRNSVDLETTRPANNSHWVNLVATSGNRSRVEGEIAAALWDIYDPVGMEPSRRFSTVTPTEDLFFEGIADPNLDKIWSVFDEFHPLSFTHGTNFALQDSFVKYWYSETDLGQHHELKAILGNRGIFFDDILPENGLGLEFVDETWQGATVRLRVRVSQPDAIDRPFTRCDLFLNGNLVQQLALDDRWAGAQRVIEFEQDIFHVAGDPLPQIIIAVYDDFNIRTIERVVTPPADVVVSGLSVRLLRISIDNETFSDSDFQGADIPDFGDHRPPDLQDQDDFQVAPPSQPVEDVTFELSTNGPPVSRTVRLPGRGTGTYSVAARDQFERVWNMEIFHGEGLPETTFEVTVAGRNGNSPFRVSARRVFNAENNYGAGPQNLSVPLTEGFGAATAVVTFRVSLRTVAEDQNRGAGTASGTASITDLQPRDWMRRVPGITTLSPNSFRFVPIVNLSTHFVSQKSAAVAKTSKKPKSPKKEYVNPMQFLARANHLEDAYRRFQEDLGESAWVLMWRLDPNMRRKLQKGASGKSSNQSSRRQNPKTKPGQSKTLLSGAPVTFLAKAAENPKIMATVSKPHQESLREWRKHGRRLARRLGKLQRDHAALLSDAAAARRNLLPSLKANPKAGKAIQEDLLMAHLRLKQMDLKRFQEILTHQNAVLKGVRLRK